MTTTDERIQRPCRVCGVVPEHPPSRYKKGYYLCNTCFCEYWKARSHIYLPRRKERIEPEGITSLPDRFWAKVHKTETCWLWTGQIENNGYGRIEWYGRKESVHRLAYRVLVGPIPASLQIDHLCRVRHCVRLDHLEPVTCRENLLRGDTINARAAARREALLAQR